MDSCWTSQVQALSREGLELRGSLGGRHRASRAGGGPRKPGDFVRLPQGSCVWCPEVVAGPTGGNSSEAEVGRQRRWRNTGCAMSWNPSEDYISRSFQKDRVADQGTSCWVGRGWSSKRRTENTDFGKNWGFDQSVERILGRNLPTWISSSMAF